MKYHNEYFKKAGIKDIATKNLLYKMKDDPRKKSWSAERKKWGGWDERSTWCLNDFMTEQIYTWLNIYLDTGGNFIDLSFYHFDVFGEDMTEREAIEHIIKILEFYLKNSDSLDLSQEERDKMYEDVKEAYRALGVILPALWW